MSRDIVTPLRIGDQRQVRGQELGHGAEVIEQDGREERDVTLEGG
jgi:hypothetical protein